ncbi:YoaK family protein [Caballeronia glebae]|uniref:YoaK family protein n=1 Tax=Caballeronia glebae TaxID=1777143 RepID=UPI0038BA378F
MDVAVAPPAALPLRVNVRRVVALTTVCGFVEVIGYKDVGGIYPAIMTGNTVQLGWSLAQGAWSRFALLAFAIGAFFIGCMIASLIRRHLKRPPLELCIMAVLLVVAGIVRGDPALRVSVELPLLALALGMQGETISRFGAVSLQTLVVTNNMVKFSDTFVGRYLSGKNAAKRPSLADVLLPGLAWLTYSLAAAVGAIVSGLVSQPLIIPALILVFVSLDLIRFPDH